MDLQLDTDQLAVIDLLRRQLDECLPLVPQITTPALTRHDVDELGWLTLGLSESEGGLDWGLVGAVILARELGRRVGPTWVLPTSVVLACGLEEQAPEPWRAAARTIRDEGATVGWVTPEGAELDDTGSTSTAYLHADLHPEDPPARLGLRLDRARVELVEVTAAQGPLVSVDGPGRAWRVEVGACHLAEGELARAARARAWAMVGAAAAGLCEEVTDRSSSHVSQRHQFGVPIGSFQAVSHRCADMAVGARATWRQACVAALSFEERRPGWLAEAAAAALLGAEHGVRNAAANLQNHGAIGYTTEVPEHRFVRRARLLRLLAGPGEAGLPDAGLIDALLDDDA